MLKTVQIYFTSLFLLLTVFASHAVLSADQSAVILLYHRFGEDKYPSTNIRLEQFEAQIEQLKSGGYHFLPLSKIIQKLKANETLPEKTITVTVDDAYSSVKEEAWPRLKKAGIPLTLFVATDPIDTHIGGYMSWADIRKLKAEGVEIAHHTASHLHMPHAGLEAAMADVRRASTRFKEELGMVPELFAYPYGEYTLEIQKAIEREGFKAAFSQVSGAAALWTNPYILPRFPVNERYGDISRFKLISQAKAMPVDDLTPLDPLVTEERNPPLFGFTFTEPVSSFKTLTCYPSHMSEPAELIVLEERRVEVRFDKPFPKGRNRINCTMPTREGRWRWLGQFFLVPGGPLD